MAVLKESLIKGRSKENTLFWKVFPKMGGWGGWFPNRPKNPQITPKTAFCHPNFSFRVPESHKNPEVGWWAHRFGKVFQTKYYWGGGLP